MRLRALLALGLIGCGSTGSNGGGAAPITDAAADSTVRGVLDLSKVGERCEVEDSGCARPKVCISYGGFDGGGRGDVQSFCMRDEDECAPVTCVDPYRCAAATSDPPQVSCQKL